jgi:hypothetical protein
MGLVVLFLAASLSAGDVSVELTHLSGRGEWVSFGLPAPSGLWEHLTSAQVFAGSSTRPLSRAVARPILVEGVTGSGGRQVRSWLIQAPQRAAARQLRVDVGGNVPSPPRGLFWIDSIPEVVSRRLHHRENRDDYRLVHSWPRPSPLLAGADDHCGATTRLSRDRSLRRLCTPRARVSATREWASSPRT